MNATVSMAQGRRMSRGMLMVLLVANLLVGAAGAWLLLRGTGAGDPVAAGAPLPTRDFSDATGTGTATRSGLASPPLRVGDPIPAALLGRNSRGAPCATIVQPNQLVIPSLCIVGAIVRTPRLRNGTLVIPDDVKRIGLWDQGAPLAPLPSHPEVLGTTLLAGHVDHVGQGRGALYPLAHVSPGALAIATDADGTVTRWRVVSLLAVAKDRLPGSVFDGPVGPRRLVLVTCGGRVIQKPGVGGVYEDNVIVTAVPA
jgi:hypothetical protein